MFVTCAELHIMPPLQLYEYAPHALPTEIFFPRIPTKSGKLRCFRHAQNSAFEQFKMAKWWRGRGEFTDLFILFYRIAVDDGVSH